MQGLPPLGWNDRFFLQADESTPINTPLRTAEDDQSDAIDKLLDDLDIDESSSSNIHSNAQTAPKLSSRPPEPVELFEDEEWDIDESLEKIVNSPNITDRGTSCSNAAQTLSDLAAKGFVNSIDRNMAKVYNIMLGIEETIKIDGLGNGNVSLKGSPATSAMTENISSAVSNEKFVLALISAQQTGEDEYEIDFKIATTANKITSSSEQILQILAINIKHGSHYKPDFSPKTGIGEFKATWKKISQA